VTRPAPLSLYRLVACLLALAGCGGGHPAARGFDSREVLPLRDPTLSLWTFTEADGDPTLIYSTKPNGTDESYWSLDIATGDVESLGTDQPASITAKSGPYSCWTQIDSASGTPSLEIYDIRTSIQTAVDNVVSYAACPQSDDVLTVFRADPTSGSPVLWTGPFTDLQPVALPMDVESVGQWLYDPSGQPTGVLVAAASGDQPNAFGLYTLDLATLVFKEDVAPVPASTAWASGAAPGGSLQSSSLATGTGQAIRAMGDHFVYARTMSDGGTTMFVGPFASGPAELALYQANAHAVSTSNVGLYQSPSSVNPAPLPALAAWAPPGVAGNGSALMIWNDTARTLVACPSSVGAAPTGLVSPDGSRVIFVEFLGDGAAAGAVTLLSLGAGPDGGDTCLALATAGGNDAGFSADGAALYWTIADGPVNGDLWAAAGDGSNPRMIGSGAISLVYFLPVLGSQRLEFYLDSDFVWVDLHDDPIVLHDVVQQVFEGYVDLGNSWLLIGYDYSTQDGTGILGLVDRDTGAARPMSPSVSSFRVARARAPGDGGTADGGGSAPLYDVVYVVRGRNPSPQDGIWLARLDASDLQ
jgi:hypothetical protein